MRVEDLRVTFRTKLGEGQAVNGVSFELTGGRTLGLLGESGSGKSVTCLALVRLLPAAAAPLVSGRVMFRDIDLNTLSHAAMRRYRGRHIAMILQDPLAALDPVFSVGEQIFESLREHGDYRNDREVRARALELLRQLNIADGERRLGNYPHQMSGGMRQRIVGAIALASDPEVLIADEPTTSLDVTVQLQYLRLLKRLQRERGLAILFVTHDLGVMAYMCDDVAVMYAGRIVERGPKRELLARSAHPYTQGLIRSYPQAMRRVERLSSIPGQPPNMYDPAPGCRFAQRCERATAQCRDAYPPEVEVSPGHHAACWHHGSA